MTTTDYGRVKKGKLKLKGVKNPSNSNSLRKRKHDKLQAGDADTEEHGGWWSFSCDGDVKGGPVAIETSSNAYIMAMDNGRFTIGAPHCKGEEPQPEEVLTLIKTPDSNWIALKSGYGKYVGVNADGSLMATSDAIGRREKWEVVFEDGKSALQALSSNRFLTCETDKEGFVYACAKTARENEIVKIGSGAMLKVILNLYNKAPLFQLRSNREKDKPVDYTPDEDRKASKDCELAYVKKYQHSKVDLNPNTVKAVKSAKNEGNLHEVLLDRRTRMKADKYCK